MEKMIELLRSQRHLLRAMRDDPTLCLGAALLASRLDELSSETGEPLFLGRGWTAQEIEAVLSVIQKTLQQ